MTSQGWYTSTPTVFWYQCIHCWYFTPYPTLQSPHCNCALRQLVNEERMSISSLTSHLYKSKAQGQYVPTRGLLWHIDDTLDTIENEADEDDLRRMLKEDYTLPPDEDDPEYVEKRNRVMDALMDFLRLLEEREMNREPCDFEECRDTPER